MLKLSRRTQNLFKTCEQTVFLAVIKGWEKLALCTHFVRNLTTHGHNPITFYPTFTHPSRLVMRSHLAILLGRIWQLYPLSTAPIKSSNYRYDKKVEGAWL